RRGYPLLARFIIGERLELLTDPAHVLLLDVKRQERTLEARQDDLFEIGHREPHDLVAQPHLLGDGRIGDEAIVGGDRHPKAEVLVKLDRVTCEVADGARLDVRRWTTLERNSVIVDVMEEVTVFPQPASMTDPVSSTDVYGLVDRLRTVRLSCVNGDV